MPATVILGAQWGDEGKGKIVDTIVQDYDLVVRYQGGNNAGHTVIHGDKVYKFHLLPSGILDSTKTCILAHGTVISLKVLRQEIQSLADQGLGADNLKISSGAHLIMPWHLEEDRLQELARGQNKIGTTGQGIGPCYTDKVSRKGLRVGDLYDDLVGKITVLSKSHSQRLSRLYEQDIVFDAQAIIKEFQELAAYFEDKVIDSVSLMHKALDDNKQILLEGAQGIDLDIDFGSYPFVTSSSPSAGGACIGTGIAPSQLNRVIGVVKAYTTRVGSGPFPTEGNEEEDKWLRAAGHEFGTTTGRPRRCGWIDLVNLDRAIKINGITEIALTKLDVLTGLKELKIGLVKDEARHYHTMPGWDQDLTNLSNLEQLPSQARDYLDFIQAQLGVRISMIGVGPRQDQIIHI